MSAGCPRCRQPLAEEQLDQFLFRVCRQCRGILGAHADVIAVVDGSWRAVPERTAEERSFHVPTVAHAEPVWACPDCTRPMEKYGYLGMKAVQIDRCDRCALLWLDTDELQNMVLALARDNYRAEHRLRHERAGMLSLGGGGGAVDEPSAARGSWLFPGDDSAWTDVLAWQLLRLVLRR